MLKASLYHTGAAGVGSKDSLGCTVVAMRTAAVNGLSVPRRTLLFIKETVGLPMPDGRIHDGYWYASDLGGAIKGARIDLFTGSGRASMITLAKLNQARADRAADGPLRRLPQGVAQRQSRGLSAGPRDRCRNRNPALRRPAPTRNPIGSCSWGPRD